MTLTEARQAASLISQKIVDGKIEPYDGAMQIWKEILNKLDDPLRLPPDLLPFKSHASVIEDCLWNAKMSPRSNHDMLIEQSKEEIIQAAAALIA
jgi:hypothetical protein